MSALREGVVRGRRGARGMQMTPTRQVQARRERRAGFVAEGIDDLALVDFF